MKRTTCFCILLGMVLGGAFAADVDPFLGRWALDLQGGGAGWLGVVDGLLSSE